VLREIMEYLGHASLAATERYVKPLPQPDERGPADRLNDYVQRAAGRSGRRSESRRRSDRQPPG